MELLSLVQSLALLLLYSNSVESSRASASGLPLPPVTVCPEVAVIFAGQDVEFNCTFTFEEAGATITWLRDDLPLTGVATVEFAMGGQLLLQNISQDWDGSQIVCSVTAGNSSGSASSNLTVYTPPTSLTIEEGMPFSLDCVVRGQPEPTVTWSMDGMPFRPQLIAGVELVEGGLHFEAASDDFSGEYVCTASSVGTGTVQSPPAIVKVLFAPRFGSVPQSTSAVNSTMVVLSCRARGCPEPTITWTHNSVPVAGGNSRVEITPEGDLVIMTLMLSDAGIYRCTAENSQGTRPSDNAMLQVLVLPSIAVFPEPTTADLGEEARLSCFAVAIPAPTYSWTHNGSVVMTDSRISISNGSLIFAPVQREDAGVYVCIVENGQGPAVMSNAAFLTVYAPPLPPETLRVLSIGPTWLLVQWGPSPEANPAVQIYILQYRLSFEETWFVGIMTDQMQTNVTQLFPNAPYLLRVAAMSPKGLGDPSEPFPVVMTEPGVPLQGSTADDIIVGPAGPNGLFIQWTVEPVVSQTSYSGATIILTYPSGAQETMAATGFSLLVGELEPATSYSVQLTLEFIGGFQGAATEASGTTADDVPSDSPTITVITTVTSDSLVLTWLPPTLPNGQIQSYSVYYQFGGSESTAVTEGTELMVELRDLRPFTNYSIAVSASTSAGEGPRSGVTVAMTDEGTPEVAPGNLIVFPLSSTSLRLSWEPLPDEDVPGILVNYIVMYNEKHHGGHAQNVTIEPNRTTHDLDRLRPFTVYCVKVAAVTGAGGGVFSRRKEARTFTAAPEATVEITALLPQNSTSILVQWVEPDPRLVHSDLSSVTYIIQYNETDGVAGGEIQLDQEELRAGLNYTLTGLEPATTYRVAMAVSNSNGTGPFGDPVENTTRDGAPVAAPGSVTVEPLNATALRVSWQPLAAEVVPGTLDTYIIRYLADGGTVLEEVVDASRSTLDLRGLIPFTNYRLMVAGATDGGEGPFSEEVDAMTLPSIPEATVDVVATVASCPPVSITVRWSSPDPDLFRGPEESICFVVIYSKVGDEEEMEEVELEERMLTLDDLIFNTMYDVRVAVKNDVGIAQTTGRGERVQTGEGVPGIPRSVTVTRSTPHTLTVTWQPPTAPSGNPSYEVQYVVSGRDERKSSVVPPGEQSVILEGLTAFTLYSIRVRAMTTCANSSFSNAVEGRTGESPPGPPVGVAPISIMESGVVVGWAEPQLPNGDIVHYQVNCPVNDPLTVSEFHAECTGLDPETQYTIAVVAVNGAGMGEEVTVEVTTACNGDPPAVEASGEGVMVMVREGENCSVRTQYVLVLVQELEVRPNGSPVPPARSLASYSLLELKELTAAYSASRVPRSRRQGNTGVYIAGNVTSDDLAAGFDLGDGRRYGAYTNHPLSQGERYNVGLRGSDTPIFMAVEGSVSPPTVEEEDSFPLITVVASAGAAGVIIVAILAIIAIIATCCCCNRSKGQVEFTIERGSSFRLSRSRKSLHPVENFRATHKTFALESHPPVPVNGFVNKLLVMRTNDNQLFLEEFGSIEMAQVFPCDAATLPATRSKNRYNNILPYDHSRVKLNSVRGQQGSTYINGNYCAGYIKLKAYIATQGPLKDTISDFWRMVWEENSKTIVMLTNPVEKAKVKCEVYWPRDVGSSELYGSMEVTLVSVTELADYTIRTFGIQKVGSGKDSREVRQFHFTSWPDHGVPQYATAMLSMTRRVRSYNDKHKDFGPMVVHCSAGVGRSGTFIAIHSTLERLDAGEELVDIYGHVSLLRSQRNYMVQTEDQYFFIHEAVAEWIVCGNTEVPLEQLPDYVNDLYQIIPEDDAQDTTFIELQFKRLAIDKNDPHRFASANRDANKCKNRYVNVLPYEINRVYLDYMRGVDGSDYINASHIDSYHYQRAFIATQGPLKNTVADFWRMVWKYNSSVVVMLTKLVEKGTERSVQYWPAELLQTETYGSFSIEMTVERNSVHYTYRDLHITDPESGQKRLVRHFHFHAWPEVGVPSSTLILLDFLREVQKLYTTLSTRAPITVHCSNGVGRSGVFIALHILLKRMQMEGLVDVFQTVKNLRIQRPAMVQTLEQYQFTYDAVVDFLEASPELLPLKSRLRSQGSNASELRRSRRSRTTSPQRSESFNTKGSTRNLEMGNGSSQVYGGSEATSTFGTAQQSSPQGSLLGSQQLHFANPAGPEQTVSVRLSYPLEP